TISSTSTPHAYPTTLNISNFVTLKLKHNNYLQWETQILSFIESQDPLGFINGDISAPSQEVEANGRKVTIPNSSSWIKITGTPAEEVLGHAVGTKSSTELWSALKEAFSQASEAREFELQSKLQYHQKIESMTITEYLSEFKSIFDQLNSIGKLVPDKRKVFLLLTNLGSAYDAFSTTMIKPSVPNYSEIIPLLYNHELR
ncbi:UBN2_3 domain-containing protein, partial [Cephalotus follicularis]